MRVNEQQASGSTAKVWRDSTLSRARITTPTVGRMAEPENSLGVLSRCHSVETPPAVRGMSRAALARLLPAEIAELETGAQVNAQQHPDACSARSLSPFNFRRSSNSRA